MSGAYMTAIGGEVLRPAVQARDAHAASRHEERAPESAWPATRTLTDPRVRATALLVEAESAPLPLERALGSLARQTELAVPAKLVLAGAETAALLAEIPRERGLASAEATARATLESALAWLAAGGANGAAAGPGPDATTRVNAALTGLGWPFEVADPGRWHVWAKLDAITMRLFITAHADGSARVAQPATPVQIAHPHGGYAARLFALESNARLRLVRTSVATTSPHVVRVTRDVVLPPAVELERWLAEAAVALAVATGETARALRALRSLEIVAAYLGTRELAAPRDDGESPAG
jgi:hypothetical protein